MTERDKAAGKLSDNENLSANSKDNNRQDIDIRFSVPDTTNGKIVSGKDSLKIPLSSSSSITPNTKQDSIKRTDSVLVKPDSSLDLKTKDLQNPKLNFERPDSSKRRSGFGKDSAKVILSRRDSILFKAKQDSIKRIDSLSQDSTARLKYFHASRDDYYVVPFREKKASSFFARPSEGVRTRQVEIDSTGKKVLIKELIGGKEDRVLLEIPIEDYIQYRLGAISRDNWEKLAYAYELKTGKKDFGQLMTDITNIQIPLPSSPLLSIFGKPGIKLKISGAVDIHGAWRNETKEGVTTSALGNTRNEPDFKQQVQINLSGTIGDKLNISADWNTERQFSYENQLKIKYTGYDDEIVQSVEAGNVSLQTSSLVGGSEALFGVKALFKMGPLSLTTIVSQKKSEVQEVSVNGGSKSNEFNIHAYSYSTNHYFIDALYASTETSTNYFYKYYGNPVPQVSEAIRVQKIEVWKTVTGLYNANERKANAFIDLKPRQAGTNYNESLRDSTQESIPGQSEINRRWIKLDPGVDYDLHEETGFITFKTQIQDEEAVAVAYYIKGSSQNQYYGEFIADLDTSASSRLVLKLVRPSYLKPQYKEAWKLQLRNIYPIGGRSINESGFTLDIKYATDGGEAQNTYNGKRLIQEFGLDKTDASGTSTSPDGNFDFFKNRTIFTYTGEIIFPVLEPFGADLPESLPASYRYDAIYDTTVTFAKQDNTKDKFLITGTYSASSSSVYSIGFNVVENSVKVYLSGNLLSEGTDYSVDYNIGEIVIRNSSALLPGADLKVTYEQNDLFQLASKTLMGLRGEYTVNKDTKLGFSFLNLNQKTLSDKVRIGEEPMNNSIYGVDLKTTVELPFITKGLDKLIPTSAVSKLNLNAEYAYINPDPNTMKSTISSDVGKSVAYIDDFEGAKKTIPLGMSRGSWKDLSLPKNLPYIGNIDKMNQLDYKAKAYWFNYTPSNVTIETIYGNRKSSTSASDNQITVLDFIYDPSLRGQYNKGNSKLDLSDAYKYWGGFMKPLSSSANDLVEENIEFIEFWVHIDAAGTGAKLNIDLGQISEDVIPNGKLDTEDKDFNGILASEADDVGLDGESDIQEGATADMPDPNNDDFHFSSGNYLNVNGTDGNKNDTEGGGLLPDTEDLNNNNNLDNVDSYFKYEIPLDTTKVNGSYKNKFIQSAGKNGWLLFRIPLKDTVGAQGTPSLSLVETIRFWFNGEKEKVHLRFAEMNLVGNQWQKVLDGTNSTKLNPVTVDDTVLTLSTINVEDNENYHLPPGVAREKDKTNTEYDVYKNEQSLDLIFSNLKDGDYREIVKYLPQTLDVFNYKEMKMYIHTDDNQNSFPSSVSYFVDTTNYSSEIYLRFGTDTLNYYEYRQPLQPSADPLQRNWSEIGLNFSELTAIKQNRDSIKNVTRKLVPGLPGHYYAVRGNPSLMKIAFFTVGIVNPSGKGPENQAISGSVWINELRVVDADQTAGWAYTASGSLNIADLMTVNANITQKNPYFHLLSERFGSRVDNLNWGMSVDFDILKLIPANLTGSNFKLAYSRTESVQNPLYMPGTDVKISDYQDLQKQAMQDKGIASDSVESTINEIKRNTQTLNISETWSVSNFKLKIPTEAWYIRDIINNISLGFNYNEINGRSPTVAKSKSWVWNANANYALTTSKELYFKPVDIPLLGDLLGIFSDYKDVKINFVPQSFTASMTASRKKTFTQNRFKTGSSETVDPTISRDFTSTRSAGFNWTITEGGLLNVAINYDVDVQSSLAYLLTTVDPNDKDIEFERSESEIWRDIFNGNLFGKDYGYRQSFDMRVNPKLPSIWDINRYINITGGYSSSYNWQNNFAQKELGISAGYSSRISAGLTVKVKSIFAPLFKDSDNRGSSSSMPPQTQGAGSQTGRRRSQPRGGERSQGGEQQQAPPGQQQQPGEQLPVQNQDGQQKEKLAVQDSSSAGIEVDSVSVGAKALKFASVSVDYLKLAFKWLLLDYDQVSINFTQTNTMTGGGLSGTGTGFNNFWGYNQSDSKGPSRLFMLGLSNDMGQRAKGGNLTDLYTQKNDLDFKTSRPLWEGAQLDLTWKVGWGIGKTIAFTTDSLDGSITITSLTSTGTIDRSFLFLPFSFLGGGIQKVGELYDRTAANKSKNLSNAFRQGFETTGFLSKIPFFAKLIKYLPRPNWNFNWSGLEKFGFLSFAKKITLQHSYMSSYSEGWKIDVDGIEEMQTQRVEYGFSPLAGTSIQLDNFLGGSITGNARYSTKSSYSLGVSTTNITESFSKDISFSLSYAKSGFEFPLFGISLKNDIEISLSYTSGKTSSTIYYMDKEENVKKGGTPQDGKTNTVIEPKIKYVMSSRVTLSIFYRRTTVKPEGASTITATTSNEAGLDVHIAIQ